MVLSSWQGKHEVAADTHTDLGYKHACGSYYSAWKLICVYCPTQGRKLTQSIGTL